MFVKDFIDVVHSKIGLYMLDDIKYIFADNQMWLYKQPIFVTRQNVQYNENYITAVDIYKCEDGYVGIKGIIKYCGYIRLIPLHAEEYVMKSSIIYIPKT